MRKIFYITLAGLFITTSCKKNLVSTVPGQQAINTFYKTPDQVNGALYDDYDVLQRETDVNSRWVFGDIGSDDALKGGETINDGADMEQFVECRPMANNSWTTNIWDQSYSGITKSNIIIDRINNVTDFGSNTALKKQYLGEALFLRAFNYYYIATLFGDAPLLTQPITDYSQVNAKLLQKIPVAQIWALIEQDLTAAIPNMLTASQLSSTNQLGRASKGAAEALLAYTLMFERKYDDAVPVLKDLIENGGYTLLPDYGAIFRTSGKFNSENIFEINFFPASGGWGESCEGSIRNVYQMSRDDWGWGFNQPTQDLANEFEAGDPRIIYTLNWPADAYPTPGGANVVEGNTQNNVYGLSSRKAFLLPSERPASASCAGKNEIIFRLADMDLLYAEALVRSTTNKNTATALQYLNVVRQRANTTPKVDPERAVQAFQVASTTLPMRSYTTDAQLLTDILHERRVELGMEGHRWFDLVRQDRTNLLNAYYQNWGLKQGYAAKGDLKGEFYTTWVNNINRADYPVMPIPQAEIDASQGNLVQTKGY